MINSLNPNSIFRPLGNTEDDYELFHLNEELYDSLAEKSKIKHEDAYKKFMGKFYNKPPKPTFKELKDHYEYRLNRKQQLEKSNADKIIIETEERNIVKLYDMIKKKDFGSFSDPVYKKYREAYEKHEESWYDSKENKDILNEIYKNNYDEFAKAKGVK